MQKTVRKNTKYSSSDTIWKIGHFAKAIANAKAIAFANGQCRSKIKNPKNMFKTILQDHWKCCVQETVRKNIKYSSSDTIWKIVHFARAIAHAKAIAFANGQFGSKIKNPKDLLKTILQEHWKCCLQKTARKNIKY